MKRTNEAAVGIIGVVDSALKHVLVEAGDVVVRLDLAGHVVAVEGEGADVLAHLLDGRERLQHLRPSVEHVLLHAHRLPRRHLLFPFIHHSLSFGINKWDFMACIFMYI